MLRRWEWSSGGLCIHPSISTDMSLPICTYLGQGYFVYPLSLETGEANLVRLGVGAGVAQDWSIGPPLSVPLWNQRVCVVSQHNLSRSISQGPEIPSTDGLLLLLLLSGMRVCRLKQQRQPGLSGFSRTHGFMQVASTRGINVDVISM